MNRIDILKQAQQLTGVDRQAVYGNPVHNMRNFAQLLTSYFEFPGYDFTPEDAAVIMVLAKLSRISGGKTHADNYIDAAAYFAIAGECALPQTESKPAPIPHPENPSYRSNLHIPSLDSLDDPDKFRASRNARLDDERNRVIEENKQAAASGEPVSNQ